MWWLLLFKSNFIITAQDLKAKAAHKAIKKRKNPLNIKNIGVLIIIVICIESCSINHVVQMKEYAYLLNKNKYSIDTVYFNTDSLIVNEKMYATLDSIIEKADNLGFG